MTGKRWKASFIGFLASAFSVTVAVHLSILLAIKADTGVFERGLFGAEAIKIFALEYVGLALAILPLWLVMALYSERKSKRRAGWYIAMATTGAAFMMLAIFASTYDSQYYAQNERWVSATVAFFAFIAAGALGGFTYWLVAGRNAGSMLG